MIRCLSENTARERWLFESPNPKRSSSVTDLKRFTNENNRFNANRGNSNDMAHESLRYLEFQCPSKPNRKIEIIPNFFIFVIVSDKTHLVLGVPIEYSIDDLCTRIGQFFQISEDDFELLFDSELRIRDTFMTFSQLKIEPGSTVECVMNIYDMDIMLTMEVIRKCKDLAPNVTSDTIFVHSRNLENNHISTSRVDIVRINFSKHFLGGYRHKTTGLEYHHVATQTRVNPKPIPLFDTYSRQTQTHKIRNRSIDNVVTTWTQMTKPGYYVSNVTDRVVTPGVYQTADELEAFIITKVIIIQKYYRRWLAMRRVNTLRRIRELILSYEAAETLRKSNEMRKRLEVLAEKKLCPLYNDDYDLLFNAIETWRLREIAKIPKELSAAARRATLARIMDDQHEWIIAVDRLKINSTKLLNFRAKKNKLVKVSKPTIWKDRFGEDIAMDMLSTTRGKEVFEIYKSLSMDFFDIEERLDILLTLKRLITGRPERICSDLLLLINREADLIMRNVSMPLLKGLRTRINTFFLILCRLPSFNSGVEKYLNVPSNPLDLRGTFQLCRYCNNYLKNAQFMFSVKSNRLGACRTCTRLFNHAMPRQELSPYRHILNLLQKAEEEYQDNSKMAFIFSEIDIKHLITKIWDSKSILSSNANLENLIFVRWSKSTEWSPWNTSLVTNDEAEAHLKLEDPCSAYCDELLNKIHQKQITGHNYFLQLSVLSDRFTVHNLKDEQRKIELAKEADLEMFKSERAVRFQ